MMIRRYRASDEQSLRTIYAQKGYSFPFPDLSAHDFVSLWVAEDAGKVVEAVVARKTVEVTAFVDDNYSNPAMRLEILRKLQERGSEDLKRQGFTDKHCWVRREIRGFGRRLVASLGWIRSQGGECYVKGL